MPDFSGAIFMLLAIMFIAGTMLFTYSRAYAILNTWAAQNGYEIIERRQAWLSRGPFFWTSNKNQVVFRVTVRDRYGATRHGWVRVGHWLLGMITDDATVIWDY
jgi:hypothetical protein